MMKKKFFVEAKAPLSGWGVYEDRLFDTKAEARRFIKKAKKSYDFEVPFRIKEGNKIRDESHAVLFTSQGAGMPILMRRLPKLRKVI